MSRSTAFDPPQQSTSKRNSLLEIDFVAKTQHGWW